MTSELSLKQKVRRALKGLRHCQGMAVRQHPGTPDLWISGPRSDLWLEFKWDPKTKGDVKPALSAPQKQWLDARHAEGRNVAVVVGLSLNELLLYTSPSMWASSRPKDKACDFRQLIDWILLRT